MYFFPPFSFPYPLLFKYVYIFSIFLPPGSKNKKLQLLCMAYFQLIRNGYFIFSCNVLETVNCPVMLIKRCAYFFWLHFYYHSVDYALHITILRFIPIE